MPPPGARLLLIRADAQDALNTSSLSCQLCHRSGIAVAVTEILATLGLMIYRRVEYFSRTSSPRREVPIAAHAHARTSAQQPYYVMFHERLPR